MLNNFRCCNLIFWIILFSLSGCNQSVRKIDPEFKSLIVKGGDFYIQGFTKSKIQNDEIYKDCFEVQKIQKNYKCDVPQGSVQPNQIQSILNEKSKLDKKFNKSQEQYIFYIEGDGLITRNGIVPTSDPTPRNKLVLRLANLDPRDNVFYLARPCQYIKNLNPTCNSIYWTDKRWAPEVVISLNEVIKKISQDHPVQLIGFSGGGGLAILIAAINHNVKSVITIAGNLDIETFNQIHRSRPSNGSLNPLKVAKKLKIPQIHLSGKLDTVVPTVIVDNYINEANNSYNTKIICPDCNHASDLWLEFWNDFVKNLSKE